VIQPIIENAIVHGLLPKPEGGKVELNIAEKDGYLVFSVKDNGIGMDSKIILKEQSDELKNGIALANIDSRLRRIYGSGLTFVSERMMGTEVLWRIPIGERSKNQ
jgi:sensor histidine kinase YesM